MNQNSKRSREVEQPEEEEEEEELYPHDTAAVAAATSMMMDVDEGGAVLGQMDGEEEEEEEGAEEARQEDSRSSAPPAGKRAKLQHQLPHHDQGDMMMEQHNEGEQSEPQHALQMVVAQGYSSGGTATSKVLECDDLLCHIMSVRPLA